MRPPLVALVDVFEPYGSALELWAQSEKFVCVRANSATLADGRECVISVIGVDGRAQASVSRIRTIRKSFSCAPTVLIARDVGIDSVVSLMRAGVADIIGAPASPSDVVARVSLQVAPAGDQQTLAGSSSVMQRLRQEIAAVAPMRSTVLITGETGVGKGVAARLIHDQSGRSKTRFVHVDCSALAPSLVESELFGHERGAFTGAREGRAGRFELAGDGTIFLDEVGDLEPGLQTKLLRVLQDREYERVGGTRTHVAAARVVAATHGDLRREVEEGRFRADLFFRLNVFHIHVSPLRERASDVVALARLGLERIAQRLELPVPDLSDDFYERLKGHRWPGNVRELMNVLERMMVRHHMGMLEPSALEEILGDSPATSHEEPAEPSLDSDLDERQRIATALRSTGGNLSRAARRLGLARSTLRYRVRQQGLSHLIPRD